MATPNAAVWGRMQMQVKTAAELPKTKPQKLDFILIFKDKIKMFLLYLRTT